MHAIYLALEQKNILYLYLLVSSAQECYLTMNDIMFSVLLKEDSS